MTLQLHVCTLVRRKDVDCFEVMVSRVCWLGSHAEVKSYGLGKRKGVGASTKRPLMP